MAKNIFIPQLFQMEGFPLNIQDNKVNAENEINNTLVTWSGKTGNMNRDISNPIEHVATMLANLFSTG